MILMRDRIIENSFIEFLVQDLKRSQLQINQLQESDAELIRLPGTDTILAITTDSISEEIETGLYSDPFLIGWMTVMINASDLAAVGADPAGILLSETLPGHLDENFIHVLQSGIKAASDLCKLPVIGGDTNHSHSFQMGGTAIGFLHDNKYLTRVGCLPGDILFISAKPGAGNCFAFSKLVKSPDNSQPAVHFKPSARVQEGKLLLDYASCCMDTSDGFFTTIDQLMLLNNTGFLIDISLCDLVDPGTLEFAGSLNIPSWMFLAGVHGEFELIFTIPPEKIKTFIIQAGLSGWNPIQIGTITEECKFQMRFEDKYACIDTARIRNLFDEAKGDIQKYIQELFKIDRSWKI
jgi:thiamine-monophosphate kinase